MGAMQLPEAETAAAKVGSLLLLLSKAAKGEISVCQSGQTAAGSRRLLLAAAVWRASLLARVQPSTSFGIHTASAAASGAAGAAGKQLNILPCT